MTQLPPSPFKGLASFADSALDALLFFGRERECEAIVANLLASRLTVLYGPSGVGKSSLLHAGVAQRLRGLEHAFVLVHDAWSDDPEEALVAAAHAADGELGPTAGLVDAVAAAAQRHGQAYLLLDQLEEYFLHHGPGGPLTTLLPELLRRPGLRVNVLAAIRSDALAELDALAAGIGDPFANLLRLDPLDREAGRAAIVGPLERYGELGGAGVDAEPELVEAVLDAVTAGRVDLTGAAPAPAAPGVIEAPFLQLVLERLWAEESAAGSRRLRLETFDRLGGAEPIVREHVLGTLERLPPAGQEAAARLVRHLVTPSGTKTSHTAADLAEYAETPPELLDALLETLVRERVLRVVEGVAGGPVRYEIFHDVLAQPLTAWRAAREVEAERRRARRQRRRLLVVVAASLAALIVVAAVAAFALTQRSSARSEARHARARELAADALADLPSNPAQSVALALAATRTAAEPASEDVLRSSLLALRETGVLRLGGRIVAAQFAPRGGRLLVASSDGSGGVYDRSGRRLFAFPGGSPLTHAAWSADGRLFATGAADGTTTVRRAGDWRTVAVARASAPVAALAFAGKEIVSGAGGRLRVRGRTFHLPGAVVTLAVAASGRLVAVASRQRGVVTTRILDARTGKVRATLPERGIEALAFDRRGDLLASGSTDATARIWDAATGRQLHVLPHRGHVLATAFSPDGRSIVTSSADGTAAVWDVASGVRVLLLTGATGIAEDAAFSPDGKQVTVAFGDRIARIYNVGDGRLLAPLAGHTDAVTQVGYDAAGTTIVTGGDDGTARLWQANAGDQLLAVDRRPRPVHAAFVGADIVSASGRKVRILTPQGHRLSTAVAPAQVVAVATHGQAFAAADAAGDLIVSSSSRAPSLERGLAVSAVAFAPDGSLVTGSRDGRVRAGAVSLRVGAPVAGVAAAGGALLVRTADGRARLYTRAGRLVRVLPGRAQLASLSPDGTAAVTASGRDAALWSTADGSLLHRLTGHRSLVTDAEFSPDGATVATASDDHDARLWDVRTGRLLHVLRGHLFPVRSASFSPDGHWVVTASQFTAGLWDATSGRLVLYLEGNTKPLTGASFSGDGSWIVTGGEDGTARVVRCDICRSLPGLQQLAAERLRLIR